MNTIIDGSPYHSLAYVPEGWKRGDVLIALCYPECEIQVTRPDRKAGTAHTTVIAAREGDMVRTRLNDFLKLVQRESSAVLVSCDTPEQAETMEKFIGAALPDWVRTELQDFFTGKKFGTGMKHAIRLVEHNSDPDFGLKMAVWHAAGCPL